MIGSWIVKIMIPNLFLPQLLVHNPKWKCDPIFNIYVWKPFQCLVYQVPIWTIYYLHFCHKDVGLHEIPTPKVTKSLKSVELILSHFLKCVWVQSLGPLHLSSLNLDHKPKTKVVTCVDVELTRLLFNNYFIKQGSGKQSIGSKRLLMIKICFQDMQMPKNG